MTGKYLFSGFLFYTCIRIKFKYRYNLTLSSLSDMKKIILVFLLLSAILFSCAHGITPYQAANGKAKCGRYIK